MLGRGNLCPARHCPRHRGPDLRCPDLRSLQRQVSKTKLLLPTRSASTSSRRVSRRQGRHRSSSFGRTSSRQPVASCSSIRAMRKPACFSGRRRPMWTNPPAVASTSSASGRTCRGVCKRRRISRRPTNSCAGAKRHSAPRNSRTPARPSNVPSSRSSIRHGSSRATKPSASWTRYSSRPRQTGRIGKRRPAIKRRGRRVKP